MSYLISPNGDVAESICRLESEKISFTASQEKFSCRI